MIAKIQYLFFNVGFVLILLHISTIQVNAQSATPTPSPQPTHCQPYGDVNCDQEVNALDFSLLHTQFGSSDFNADINSSLLVDAADVEKYLSNYKYNTDLLPRKVITFISEDIFPELQTDLEVFKEDVHESLGVEIDIQPLTSAQQTPEIIRSFLQNECEWDERLGCRNLEGVILVGDLPFARFSEPYSYGEKAIFVYYYEDLDATFTVDDEGYFTGYASLGAQEGPEIYSAWIKPMVYPEANSLPDDLQVAPRDSTTQLKDYFAKHHRFFTGQVSPQFEAVFASHCAGSVNSTFAALVLPLYGLDHTTSITPDAGCDAICPLNEAVKTALSQPVELSFLHSHGTPSVIWCFNSLDFQTFVHLPLFMATWGCNNGNFDGNENNSTALSFIHGPDIGLSYFAKLHSSDIAANDYTHDFINPADFFAYWNNGDYVGKAYLRMSRLFRHKPSFLERVNNHRLVAYSVYRESGPLQRIIIGSPFSYSKVGYARSHPSVLVQAE
ncbi:hypothetical protein C4579_04380 [Candidatus Microgenomates bacterium]|nr:MAG: hypothetical protein C4579_04380 [Candidatus Microgenomates bacterium]